MTEAEAQLIADALLSRYNEGVVPTFCCQCHTSENLLTEPPIFDGNDKRVCFCQRCWDEFLSTSVVVETNVSVKMSDVEVKMNSIEAWKQDPELMKNAIKELRVSIDGDTRFAKQLAEAIARGNGGREVALSITKLQEAKMWAGQALGEMGHKLPEEFRDEAK